MKIPDKFDAEIDIPRGRNVYAFCDIPEKSLLYVAVTKAGSTSIRHLLGLALGISPNDNDILQKMEVPKKEWQSFYKFSFVRNPYDRMVSCYRDKVIDNSGQRILSNQSTYFEEREPKMSRHTSFAEFVDIIAEVDDLGANSHLRSQYSLLYLDEEPLYDWLGRVESFRSDWAELAVRFDLPVLDYQANVSNLRREDYREMYTDEVAERIYQRYQLDFEVFGYDRLSYKKT